MLELVVVRNQTNGDKIYPTESSVPYELVFIYSGKFQEGSSFKKHGNAGSQIFLK